MPKSAGSVRFDTGHPVQVLAPNGSRVNITSGGVTSAATSLSGVVTPGSDNTPVVFVRASDWVWIAFGTGSVAAAANATSILCPPGEGVYVLDSTVTHFAVLQFSAAATVQIEGTK